MNSALSKHIAIICSRVPCLSSEKFIDILRTHDVQ